MGDLCKEVLPTACPKTEIAYKICFKTGFLLKKWERGGKEVM
jgi:hypothetical protein